MSRSLREYRTIQRWAVGEGASSSAHVVGGARKRKRHMTEQELLNPKKRNTKKFHRMKR